MIWSPWKNSIYVSLFCISENQTLINLFLAKNKIKYMNGALFANSPNLRLATLNGNICIDEVFDHDRIVMLSDEVSKQCGSIDEHLMEHFIGQCKKDALRVETELNSCTSIAEPTSREDSMKHVLEKLQSLLSSQERHKEVLQKFIEDESNKDLQIKTANEKLQKAENEILELKKQIEKL